MQAQTRVSSFVPSFVRPPLRQLLRPVVAAALALGAAQAQAVVGPPTTTDGLSYGGMRETPYGTTGQIFELFPRAFIEGLGQPDDASDVVALTPDLVFADPVFSGFGTGLLTIEYRITNVGATAFNDIRFVVWANPDGGADPYLDQVSVFDGPASDLNADLYEVQPLASNPFDAILARFGTNKSLTTGLAADCSSPNGCDAEMALQWNAALNPNESFIVRVGLSDNGQTLSSRYIQANSVTSASTQLIFSGTGEVVAVPEASTWALLGAGLAGVAVATRRTRRQG